MTKTKQSKEYRTPHFQLVRQNELHQVFFAASETPAPTPGTAGSINTMTVNTSTEW